MAPVPLDTFPSRSAQMKSKDPASKRKRVNRSAKLKQCKLEVRREQWLAYQVPELKQGENSHSETDPCITDPGEVIHPKSTATEPLLPMDSRVSWASLLISSASAETQKNSEKMHAVVRVPMTTEEEPDPDLLKLANSKLHSHLHIKRPGQKDSGADSSPSLNPNSCTAYECGDMDASPKSCGEGSPKTKASKVTRGSRRSRRGNRSNSKENECTVAEHAKENKGRQRRFDGTQAREHGQEQRFCCGHETEDGWEAATDVLGLHSVPKKSSNVLQTQAMHHNNQRHTRTKIASLLGMGPSKQPDLQRRARGKAWMQGDLRRPTCLPSLTKQCGACAQTCLNSHSEKPQCPICAEDLDSTDTLFDSCPCGFNLCLFCYHKIASDDNRCPGCRRGYMRDVSAKPSVVLPV